MKIKMFNCPLSLRLRQVSDKYSGVKISQSNRRLIDEAADEIDRLQNAINETLTEQSHLADGDNCTLIKLKNAAMLNK